MKLASALAAIFVCGCAASEILPPQGLVIEVRHDGIASVMMECGRFRKGCARWTGFKYSDTCEIHYRYGDENTRHHELTHCARGHFH